jgi:cysteinyl-tRNA synthetase
MLDYSENTMLQQVQEAVLEIVRELVVGTNAYIERTRMEPGVNRQLIKAVATYITKIFDIFGQISTEEALEEILLMPFHSSLAEFRGNVRGLASEVKAGNILAECDTLRDVVLPNLGVRLEDKEGEPPVIKQVPVTALVHVFLINYFLPIS